MNKSTKDKISIQQKGIRNSNFGKNAFQNKSSKEMETIGQKISKVQQNKILYMNIHTGKKKKFYKGKETKNYIRIGNVRWLECLETHELTFSRELSEQTGYAASSISYKISHHLDIQGKHYDFLEFNPFD